MVKTMIKGTTIEIWSRDYINEKSDRLPKDRHAEIIQIERGNNEDDYIVEIRRKSSKDIETEDDIEYERSE